MHPDLARRFGLFSARMAEAAVPFALNSVLRTYNEQLAYAAQGRTLSQLTTLLEAYGWTKSLAKVNDLSVALKGLDLVNRLRSDAGMAAIGPKDNSYTVTNTLNSRHFPDASGKSRAFDIVVLRSGKVPHWDVKWDDDKDGIADYEESVRISESVGLVPGGRWKSRDWPHHELPR
jgi:hypothetical protein